MPRRRSWIVAAFALVVVFGGVGLLLRPGPDDDPSAVPSSVPTGRSGDEVEAAATPDLDVSTEAVGPPSLRGTTASEARSVAGDGASRRGVVVSGLVYDQETREPLAGVTVTVRGGEGTEAATTDARGVYRFKLTRHVFWYERLGFSRRGYVSGGLDGFAYWPRPHGRLEPVGLDPVRTLLPGRALDWQGRPVADAHVRVERAGTWYRSDARGRFGPVPVGGRQIVWLAWAAGCARTDDYVDLEPRMPDEILVRLVPHGVIAGGVVDEAGAPVRGAEIFRMGFPDERRLVSDAWGRFRWPLSFDGGTRLIAVSGNRAGMTWGRAGLPLRIVVRALGDGVWRRRFAPTMGPRPPPGAEVASRPRVAVRVQTVDACGRPLAWADVRVTGRGFEHHERTDAVGRCVLRVPSDWPLRLAVDHHAAHHVARDVSFAARQAHDLRIPLPPRPPPRPREPPDEEEIPAPSTVLRGVVHDARDRPIPGVSVEAPPWGDATSDVWGRWRIEGGTPEATARLLVSAEGFAPFEALAVFGGSEVTLRLPPRSALRVRLEGRADEDAVPQVRVWVPPDNDDDLLSRASECICEDEDGYRVDCPVGTWTVAVRLAPGEWAVYPDVRVVEGRETTLTYDFPRFGRLRIRVRAARGGPVPDPYVAVALTDSALGIEDEGGLLEFEGWNPITNEELPAGVLRLRVEADGYAPTFTRPVDLRRDETLEVVLERGVRVTGIVRDAAGRPIVARVAWVAPRGPALYATGSDAAGTFELEGALPPGRTLLRVRRDGHAPLDTPIIVPAGREEVAVDLRVPWIGRK